MFYAITISIIISTIILVAGHIMIKPRKITVPKVSHCDYGKNIEETYNNLKKHGINTRYDYNKREQTD